MIPHPEALVHETPGAGASRHRSVHRAGGVSDSGSGSSGPTFRMFVLPVAVWLGLVAGLLEASVLAFRQVALDRMIFVGPAFVWMAPVADVLLLVGPGAALALAARRWPRLASTRVATFVLGFGATVAVVLHIPGLHRYAVLLLAAGVATQLSRAIAARPERFAVLVRRSLPWLAALILALAAGVHGRERLAELRALAQLPAPPPAAPNVLFLVLDTVRAQNLSAYGYVRPTTPALEALAAEGVRFDRAFAPSPWTTPTHASLFTGRMPHEFAVTWLTPLDGRHPTLAEALASRGYATAGFVANVSYTGRETGLARGFAHYEDFPVSPAEIPYACSIGRVLVASGRLRRLLGAEEVLARKSAEAVTDDFLDWVDARPRRPFFAFLNYYDAHEPYLPPPPFDERFGSAAPRRNGLLHHQLHHAWRTQKERMSPAEVQAELDAYDGAIAYLDHHLGRLLDGLRERGLFEHTLVVVTSDHGEQFGEHGLFEHGNSLYRQVLEVPLLISLPGRLPAGASVRAPVSLRDVPATVLDLTGVEAGAPIPGLSLARHWRPSGSAEGPGSPGTSSNETLLSEFAPASLAERFPIGRTIWS